MPTTAQHLRGANGILPLSLAKLEGRRCKDTAYCEDKSSEQTFYSAWAIRISTAMQRGTALMIHNIPLGNCIKSRRTKDVDIEPPAAGSGTRGESGGNGDDSDDGQLGSDSDSEVEVSDSEAEIELDEVTATGGRRPRSNNNSKSSSNSNSNRNRNRNKNRGGNDSAVKRPACADRE